MDPDETIGELPIPILNDAHPIFRTPELVALIMIELHGDDECAGAACNAIPELGRCTQVCKQWSNIIIKELWQNHANLDRYFALMGEFEPDSSDILVS